MQSVDCIGVGYTESDIPVIAFEVEMATGRDFKGKFDIAFAVAEIDEETQFVILQGSEKKVVARISEQHSPEFIDALLTTKKYKTYVNYENTSYETVNAIITPILGRVVGSNFDWVETTELPSEHIQSLREMRKIL
jgi:hypothetical protein